MNPAGYLYPFDQHKLGFIFRLIGDNGEDITPNKIVILTGDSHFIYSEPEQIGLEYKEVETKIEEENSNITGTVITYSTRYFPFSFYVNAKRPIYQVIIFFFVSIIAFVIIMWTTIRVIKYKVEITDTIGFIGIYIAIMISLPELRGFLVPSNIQFTPIYDFITVFVWFISIMGILILFTKKRHDSMV